jgi:delta-aminolevulinic acid dehydratase/porphobilinogen synthase
MIENVSSIFNSAESTVQSMPDKSRIQLKELAQSVANSTNLDPKDVLAFVTFFARNTELGYVSRGKNGGLIRGKRPLKSAPPQSSSTSSAVDDDDSDEE